MKLIFEKSVEGRYCASLPKMDVPEFELGDELKRSLPLRLPEVSENELSRHYSSLERRSFGVNRGFFPLGSCTMKYNPKINEDIAKLEGFTEIHPLAPVNSVSGCMEVFELLKKLLLEITGMDNLTFQPSAGAQGELTGIMMIKKYHRSRKDNRDKIIIPDSAHGTNPATASMCGMKTINIPSNTEGRVDINRLKEVVGKDTAGLMLTNPNTLGIFEKDVLEITDIIHKSGGLNYFDGANLNAIMGVVRPGDMGFDCVHLNLHKTFSTPHGGGGPGSGVLACKDVLSEFLPNPNFFNTSDFCKSEDISEKSIGRISGFYGNFLVSLKALCYLLSLGKTSIPLSAKTAVLNSNYFKYLLSKKFNIPFPYDCMHEFIISMKDEAKNKGVTANHIAKMLIDRNIHPPTVYFPLIVKEALMIEPTETEAKELLDDAAEIFLEIYDIAMNDPEMAKAAPINTEISRPDEVLAARKPILNFYDEENFNV
ncbi:MAG: aminomethyl-transferring glycine dehydrogenase subunit GcvPB [Ruminococcaceae bacterium]|nr:aminomethyl-transferring glycine dehydrogenase subunit GcvPB [Oscillospiraceae bacterium]